MTGVEGDYNRMFEAMRETFLASLAIIAVIPGAGDLVDQFIETIDDISANGAIQSIDISGVAVAKATKKTIMINNIEFIATSCKSYAVTVGDEELEAEMSWKEGALSRLPDMTCANTCKGILDKIEPFMADLATYDITASIVLAAQDSIDAFRTAIPKPRTKIVGRSNSTKSIGSLIRKGVRILKKLDAKMEPLKDSRPAFFNAYFGCRKVINTGTRALSFRAKVTDVDGVGLGKVKITFEGLRLIKRTTEKGSCQVKHFDEGTYRATLSLPGFVDEVREFFIVAGNRCDIEVVMERILVSV